MINNRNFWGNGKINTGSIIIGAVVMIVAFVLLLSLAQLTYKLLTFIAVPLLIATAIIDHKVILGYVNWIVSIGKRNIILGVVTAVLSLVLYPLTISILFGRAFLTWRFKKAMEEREEEIMSQQPQLGEYIDYEEMPKPRQRIKEKRVENNNEYDQFFDE
ncbi:MAG: hypothetical protein AAGI23_00815 [Bacteroidota bacterium]